MIDFREVWLPQILRYALLIRDEAVLRRAWVDGRTDETSVVSPEELLMQVFEDLDSQALVLEASRHLPSLPGLVDALKKFLQAMATWDRALSVTGEGLMAPWADLRASARRLLDEAEALESER